MTRNDGTRSPGRQPAEPAPKDERRETEERLAEATGGRERRKARRAREEDPGLPSPGDGGKKGGPGRR